MSAGKVIGWIVVGLVVLVVALLILYFGWFLYFGNPRLPNDRVMLDKSSFTAETCAGKFFDGYTGEIEVSNPQRRITGTSLVWKDGKFRSESVDRVVEEKLLKAHGLGLYKRSLGEYTGDYAYVGEWKNGYAHGQGKYTEDLRHKIDLTCDGKFKDGEFVEGTVNGKASTSCPYHEYRKKLIEASMLLNDRRIVYQDEYVIACRQE